MKTKIKARWSGMTIAPLFIPYSEDKLILLPKLAHILQTLAFGLWNQLPYEEGGYDTDGSIQTIGKPMAEVIARR